MSFVDFITEPFYWTFFGVAIISLFLALKLYNIYKFTDTIDPFIFSFVMIFEFANMIAWLFLWGYINTFCGESLCFSISWIWFHNAVAASFQVGLWYFLLLHALYLHFRLTKTQLSLLSTPYILVSIHMYIRWLFPSLREGTLATLSIILVNVGIPLISLSAMIISYVVLKPLLKTKRTQKTRIAFIIVNFIIIITYIPYSYFQNLPSIDFVLVGFLILGIIAVWYPQTFLISTSQILCANELYTKIKKEENISAEGKNSTLVDYIEYLKANGVI